MSSADQIERVLNSDFLQPYCVPRSPDRLDFFIGGIVGETGAVIYGWFHDLTGSYAPAFSFVAGCCLLTLLLVVLTRSEKNPIE